MTANGGQFVKAILIHSQLAEAPMVLPVEDFRQQWDGYTLLRRQAEAGQIAETVLPVMV